MERGAEVEEGIGSEKEREAGGAGHDARGGREKIGEEEAGGERSGEWGLRERGKGGGGGDPGERWEGESLGSRISSPD